MKAKDVRELALNELENKERELTRELFDLNFQKQTGQLQSSVKIGLTKKDLARVKTILREKKITDRKEG